MKEAGCVFIAYGIESGNREVLRRMKKGITPEQIEQAIKWTSEVGIENRGSCIVGHPGDTFERFMETVKFVKGLPTGFVNFFNIIPYPGTEVHKWVKNNAKLLYPEDVYLNEFEKGQEEPIFETDDFPLSQRKAAIKMARRLYKKLILQHNLGKKLGYLAYQAAKIPLLWKIGCGIFKGSRSGTKIFSWFLKRRNIKTTW